MKLFKRYKTDIFLFVCFSFFFFFLRFFNLMKLPLFTDEAIYMRWAQIAGHDANQRFISLTDGKQPLFIWLSAAVMRVVNDPLMSGRIVSVFAGFLTMVGLYFLGREIFKNKWVGIVSAFLYLIYPFGLVYDRMALYDSLVGTFTVWALYVEILLVRHVRADLGFLLGFVVGGGMLNKTNAFFSMYLLPFTALLFDFKQADWKKKLVKWIAFSLLAVLVANTIYGILRLSPWFYLIGQKDATFVYPIKEWIYHPFTFFFGNIHGMVDWFITYVTIPIIILIAAAFFVGKTFLKEKLVLLIWFILPFIALALFGKVLYPRYILFMTLSLLPLAAYTVVWMYGKFSRPIMFYICFLLVFISFSWTDALILTDFAQAPLPQSDLRQYIDDWPSGQGLNEIVAFLEEKSKTENIYVLTQGTFGLLPHGLEIYLIENKNITIESMWPVEKTIPPGLLVKAKTMPTYIIFYQPCEHCSVIGDAPKSWPLTVVKRIQKADGIYMTLYQVNK